MEEHSQDDIISLVNSIFDVSDFIKTEFSMEFRIEDIEFKSKFEQLARKLEGMSFACRLEQKDGGKFVIIQKFAIKKQRRWMKTAWTPRALFAIVIAFVVAVPL